MCIKKIYIYLFIYFKPLKGEAIHETGLSGNVVASFFPLIIFICLYMYIKKNIYIYIYKSVCAFYFSNSKLLDILLQRCHLDICFLCWIRLNRKWQQFEFLQWI